MSGRWMLTSLKNVLRLETQSCGGFDKCRFVALHLTFIILLFFFVKITQLVKNSICV